MRMISVSAGNRRPRRCARGSRTARLCAKRTRRSSSARRPSSEARSVRNSASARAAFRAAVWRAMTSHSAASSATSQKAIQCRPLSLTSLEPLEHTELRRSRAWVDGDFLGLRQDRFLGEHATKRATPAGADRLLGRTDAVARPVPKRVFYHAILTRVIGDDTEPAARNERIAQRGQRGRKRVDLFVDRDAQRLKQTREIRRPRARSKHGADRVDEIVADAEGRRKTPADDFSCERPGTAFIRVLAEYGRKSLDRPRIQDVLRSYASPVPCPPCPHPHIQRRTPAKREATLGGIDLMRAHAEVEQDAIGMKCRDGGESGSGSKRVREVLNTFRAEPCLGRGNGIRIAVDPQDPRPQAP